MKFLISVLLALTFAFGGLTGCNSAAKAERERKAALRKKAKAELRDENTDVDFQAFIGRLRKAVSSHDVNAIATMMTPNFGYKLSPPLEGDGVFKYWDQENLWPELDGILSEKFVKGDGDYMVAPPQFADKSLNYDGYRAGVRRINGSWKFAYFVNG
ncbi:MAG TPA: hypothetical protein VGM62_18510 [Chthoniobacterales bacterium]